MEVKEKYISELLQNIRHLEARVSSVRSDEALSFSFFRDAFQKAQETMRLLHELEMHQIEEMKRQMEKLVVFLSENEVKKEQPEVKPAAAPASSEPIVSPADNVSADFDEKEEAETAPDPKVENSRGETDSRNRYAEGIVLPVYTNPRADALPKVESQPVKAEPAPANDATNGRPASLSVNDVLQAPPAKVEVKRSLSLNDRFFYQRELFGNDREAMNAMMDKLGGMNSLAEIEGFLKGNTSWNFDDETVKAFIGLLVKSHE